MERPFHPLFRRPTDVGALLVAGRTTLRWLLILVVGLWMMVQVPSWTSGSATATVSSPHGTQLAASEAERFDTPAGADLRIKLKAMIACEPTISKDPDWHPADLTATGVPSLFAGTRGCARIPADRIRQTAVSRSLPYHLRAPPVCG